VFVDIFCIGVDNVGSQKMKKESLKVKSGLTKRPRRPPG
jgi:hypothetical protein